MGLARTPFFLILPVPTTPQTSPRAPPHPEKAQLSDSSQAGHLACPH